MVLGMSRLIIKTSTADVSFLNIYIHRTGTFDSKNGLSSWLMNDDSLPIVENQKPN